MAVKQPQPSPSATSSSSRSGHQFLSSPSRTGPSGEARSTPAVESSVTRLLVSIKQLLESLTNWSNSKASEEEVSDVYVRLGNDFNVVVVAFAHYDIDMSELLSVPDDLRAVLEDCLSDDASTVALEKYLPNVRSIITKLLQGLRKKQSEYRNTTKRGLDASGHSRTGRQLSRPYRVSSRREVSKLQSSSISPLPSPPSTVHLLPESTATPPAQRRRLLPIAATAPRTVPAAYRGPSDEAEGTDTRSIEERELELSRKEREVAQREAEVEEREEAAKQRGQEAEDLIKEATRVAAWAREMMQALAEAQAQAHVTGVYVPPPLVGGEGSDESDVEDDEQSADEGTPGAGLRESMATLRSTWYTVRTVKSYKERTNRGPPKKDVVPE